MKKKTKVICGGCFNRLHKGHVKFLKKCKSLGSYLIVVVSNNVMNRKKYGKLAVSAMKRKKSIEKLGIVDKVLIGHKIDKLRIIKKEKPDTIALGYDQNMPELDKISIKKKRIQRFHKS